MSFRVELTKSARRALTKDLPESVAAACREFLHGGLADDPHRAGKPLRGEFEGLHSARRGEFRVIYEIIDALVVVRVIHIRHRRDAYRR